MVLYSRISFLKSLDIHPILIILLIIAGGQLFGLLGMMLIIPTTTVLKTAVKEIYFALKNYKIAQLVDKVISLHVSYLSHLLNLFHLLQR
jgi:predicted PurR-regulated permease PerM